MQTASQKSTSKEKPTTASPSPAEAAPVVVGVLAGQAVEAGGQLSLPTPAAATVTTTTTVTTMTTITTTVAPAEGFSPPPSPPTLDAVLQPSATTQPTRRDASLRSVRFGARGLRQGMQPGAGVQVSGRAALNRSTSSLSINRSVNNLQSRLKRAVSRLGSTHVPVRTYSYASLNEHLLVQSLTRSWARKDWRAVGRILFGWTANVVLFGGMCLLFALYGCEIYLATSAAEVTGRELILSWVWSIFQRFIVNEPALILAGKGLPMLFSSAFCALSLLSLITMTP